MAAFSFLRSLKTGSYARFVVKVTVQINSVFIKTSFMITQKNSL